MSIRILAFNTTTTLCSVALMVDQQIYTSCDIITSKHHSEKILFMIDQLLSETGVNLRSLDGIIFDRGPGSFVGVRIGISVAQGLALGVNVPLIEVSSLVVLAQGAWRIFGANKVITTIDARIGELYWATHYRTIDDHWEFHSNEMLVTEVFAQRLICELQGNWVLVGTGWNNYLKLTYVSVNDVIILRSIMFPAAQDMLSVGMCKWKNKSFIELNQIKPIYLCNTVCTK